MIVRRPSHGSKNDRGAEAFVAFSVVQTAVKRGVSSTIDTLHTLFRPKPRDGPVQMRLADFHNPKPWHSRTFWRNAPRKPAALINYAAAA
jgi:hypothetical protein